jgi:glycosyltransferase involved in cell wall biosynthesis
VLDPVDVGMVLSLWEEAYGYVGPEFLAKGIPVIGNAIGGIVEYTRDGETGWLNRSRSAEELARIMLELVERPDLVVEMAERVRAARDQIVKPFARHADEMEAIYTELACSRP